MKLEMWMIGLVGFILFVVGWYFYMYLGLVNVLFMIVGFPMFLVGASFCIAFLEDCQYGRKVREEG